MKIITISREFGSGGRELGKRLSDVLGFDYYDREIIAAVSETQGMAEDYIERALDNHTWRAVPMTFRHSFASPAVMGSPQVSLLLEQKRIIEGIAKRNRDCIIVGRNADVILKEYDPYSIFVCAADDAKIKRCMERAGEGEKLSRKQIEQNMRRIDRNRAKTREFLCSYQWGDPAAYDMTINTTYWDMKTLAPAAAEFAMRWFGGKNENSII